MMWCEATDFKVMQVQFSQSDGAFSRSVGEIPFTRIYCLANKPSQFWVKVCSSLLQPSCFLRPISWLTKSRPLPEQMFSPADLEVLQDLSARSQSGFWRAVGWLKRVWTPRRRFLGAWVNSSCGWWWREAVQRAFFFSTGNCLFTVKGRLRWMESVTMKGSHTLTCTWEKTQHTSTHRKPER